MKQSSNNTFTVYDNGGASIDRYTIFKSGVDVALAASDEINGAIPFLQFCFDVKQGQHLGQQVPFSSLPYRLRLNAIANLA
jgi:hypothetical protein